MEGWDWDGGVTVYIRGFNGYEGLGVYGMGDEVYRRGWVGIFGNEYGYGCVYG